MTEILEVDPEPCDECAVGVATMHCYDGVRRCRNCVTRLAEENGWNAPVITPPEGVG